MMPVFKTILKLFNIVIIFNLILYQLSFSQDNIKFKRLSIEHGLSQSTINCIFQDSKGFMWIGTQDGLNKFDGYNFEIFKHHPLDSNTISHNWIWDVFEDKNGHIWISTWYGLNKYDPKSAEFIRYFSIQNDRFSLSNNRPITIKDDNHGNLWIATWGGGLNYYDFETNHFYSYQYDPQDDQSLNNNFVRTLNFDSNGLLWIGTWNGLCYINPDSVINKKDVEFTRYFNDPKNPESLSGNKVLSIIEDKNGKIWIGTMFHGLNRFDKSTRKFTQYKHNINNPKSISSNSINEIYQDSFDNLWIATQDEGLNRYIPGKNEFKNYKSDYSKKANLSSNKLTRLYEDKSGSLWIGTSTSGMNILNLRRNKFSSFSHSQTNNNSLSGDLITCFYQDKSGYLWVGTQENGLNRYNPRSGKFKHYRHDPKNPKSISHNNIRSIVEDKFGHLWVATFGGLNKLNMESNTFYHFKNNPDNLQSLSSNSIEALLIDKNDILWVATSSKGLDRHELNSQQFEHFRFDINDPTSISSDYLLSLFEDSFGSLWIGGWGGGLNKYNAEKNRFDRYRHNPSNPNSLSDDIVNSIYETKSNGLSTLWVGTSGGISFMTLADSSIGKFNHLFEKDGLPNQHIYGILEDDSGNLWFSTNKGVAKYTYPHSFRNFDSGDGLPQDEFSSGAYYKGNDGQLYFGCTQGFISFFPDSIKNSSYIPPIVITNFELYKESKITREGESYLSNKQLILQDEIILSYSDNIFSIEFAALDYTAPKKNKYAYKLQGFKDDWIYTDASKRFATYTNLDPGEYIFRVKGSNSDGIWNEKGTSIKIAITPPFWKTWWFRVLLFLLISGGITFLIMYRIRQHLKIKAIEKQAEEKMRSKVAADFHDELGNRITKISLFSEILKSDNEKISAKTREYLNKINDNASNLYNETRDFIWHLDPQKDTLHDLAIRLKTFGDELFDETNTNFEFYTNDGIIKKIRLQMDWRQHILRIFKEAMHNALKYAESKNVKLKISAANGNAIIELSDDGKGFDLYGESDGEGLKNMKNRAEAIQSELKINSDSGKGTQIQLIINLP